MQLKALLVNGDPARGEILGQSLLALGHDVVADIAADSNLLSAVEAHAPDILAICCDRPADALLGALRELSLNSPMPVLLFAGEADREAIRKAVRAGVSACVVDGLAGTRVGSILEVALVRFSENERLRRELADTRANLVERKAVERAKGILMKQRGFDEPQAYHALRKMAMDRNLRIGEVAENVIAVADLLN